jgi:FkbM family methyltransferase
MAAATLGACVVTTLERIQYAELQTTWQTPRGRVAVLTIRHGTNDWNTVNATMGDNDEYGLRDLHLEGLAIDIGAYVGSVSIALALDNPSLRVVAVEAIGENAELCRRNAEQNGVADRVTVIHAAAAAPGVTTADVFWRAQGTTTAEHHAFVGNSTLVYEHGDANHETETVACVDLVGVILGAWGGTVGPASFLKIDCEGCEWGFLLHHGIANVPRIHGEWHPVQGHVREDILRLLPDHEVVFSGPEGGPGGFVAVRR